jgi:BirA family biotin operon repressor/biotin-[acetyl-CoA-carboxylase] ligase
LNAQPLRLELSTLTIEIIYADHVAGLFRERAVLDPTLGALLEGTIFNGRVHRFATIHSTNSALLADAGAGDEKAKAAPGQPEGTVYIADEQTAGRGRGGHSWHSAPGVGLYLSALLRPSLAPNEMLGITLAAGIAAAQAVSQIARIACDLRWPNDLLVNEKKVGGILTEMSSGNGCAVVVGFGINVNHGTLPAELASSATSLYLATGTSVDLMALAAALLQFFDREYRGLQTEELRALLARFEERSSYVRGKSVTVGEEGGYEGVTAGLDQRGFLRVKTSDGIRTVLSGRVRAK